MAVQIRAEGVDDARDLVAEGDGTGIRYRVDGERRAEAAVDQMDVGQAYSGGPDLDEDLARSGDRYRTSSTANVLLSR